MINEPNQELLEQINNDLWIKEIGIHMLHSKKSAVVKDILKKFDKEGGKNE